MPGSSALLSPVSTNVLLLTSFLMGVYIVLYYFYPNIRLFAWMLVGWFHQLAYESSRCVNFVTILVAWTKRWHHWGDRGASLSVFSMPVPVDMPFIQCVEELTYVARHAAIVAWCVNLPDEEVATYILAYVVFQHQFGQQHRLTSFGYWFIDFECRLCLK